MKKKEFKYKMLIPEYANEILGRIPEDDEKPVIETEKVTYKIEEY